VTLQSIESHHLFTTNMNHHDMTMIREITEQESPSTAVMNLGQKTPWNLTSDTMEDSTAINPLPVIGAEIAINSSPHLGLKITGVTAAAKTMG